MKEFLTRTFRYLAWANQRAFAELRATPAAQLEALPLLSHLLAAEHVWLARLEQREPRYVVWPSLSLDQCEKLATENELGYQAWLAPLTDDQLAIPIHYRNSQGTEFTTPALDILTQVITHGPYHRGQIARVIGRNHGQPINTDFITFVREVP